MQRSTCVRSVSSERRDQVLWSGHFVQLQASHTRLVDHASLFVLRQMLARQGKTREAMLAPPVDWAGLEPILSDWILRSVRSLAHAIVSASAVIDVEEVIIDGAFPPKFVPVWRNCLNPALTSWTLVASLIPLSRMDLLERSRVRWGWPLCP